MNSYTVWADIYMNCLAETDLAYGFAKEGEAEVFLWLPKSQATEFRLEDGDAVTILEVGDVVEQAYMPQWLAANNELEYEEVE